MRGEADRDAHVGEGVLEDEVPADDPGDELAHGGVGVGVGGAGDGDHAGELGVAEAGEGADDGDEDQREGEGGAGAGAAGEGGVVDEVVGQGRVEDGGGVELFAGDGGADDGEDARADDGADAEGGERDGAEGFLERRLRALRTHEMSLSMDLVAKICRDRVLIPRHVTEIETIVCGSGLGGEILKSTGAKSNGEQRGLCSPLVMRLG